MFPLILTVLNRAVSIRGNIPKGTPRRYPPPPPLNFSDTTTLADMSGVLRLVRLAALRFQVSGSLRYSPGP